MYFVGGIAERADKASKLKRDPFFAQWTTNDEDFADVEESADFFFDGNLG